MFANDIAPHIQRSVWECILVFLSWMFLLRSLKNSQIQKSSSSFLVVRPVHVIPSDAGVAARLHGGGRACAAARRRDRWGIRAGPWRG